MARKPGRAAFCLGSALIAAIVPLSLYAGAVLMGDVRLKDELGGPHNFIVIPAATFFIAFAVTAAFYLPAAILITWLERRALLNWRAPLLVLASATVFFAAAFAWLAFPPFPHVSGVAAVWLMVSCLSSGLGVHWTLFMILRAKRDE